MPRDQHIDLKPLKPGAWRNGTRLEAAGRWFETSLVRWHNGRLRPVGGWQLFATGAVNVPIRGGLPWRANNGLRLLALGSATKLYVHDNGALTDITPAGFVAGRVDSVFGLGFGSGLFGLGTYGTPRTTSGIVFDATTWTFDNFGEVLIGVSTGDGKLYEWTPSQLNAVLPADRLALQVLNSPINNSACFVTAERHVVALGAGGNPRLVRWCSRENRTLWTAASTNSAGEFEVATAGRLMYGARFRNESLLFTETDVHLMRYVGGTLIYGREQVGKDNGLVGPGAVTVLQDRVVWMGFDSFWSYDGVVREIPGDLNDYVFKDINLEQRMKFTSGHNTEFSEIWWFYCSSGSVENDRYVIWNYAENWWSYGQLARTTWIEKGIWPYSVAAAPDGKIFQHEQGWTNSGVSRLGQVFAATGAIELGRGERFTEVKMLFPDGDENEPGSEDNVKVSFRCKETAKSAPYRTAGPYLFNGASGYVPARFTARQVEMVVEPIADDLFSFGKVRAEIAQGSGR